MNRSLLLSLILLAAPAVAQTTDSAVLLRSLAMLEEQLEAVADEAALVCRSDVTNLAAAGEQLGRVKELSSVLAQIERRYGAREDFPAAEARRIGGRIASLEDSLLRLEISARLLEERKDAAAAPPKGQLLFEAAQSLCPDDDAADVFDDVCKAQGGTSSEECSECFFGLFTCCEKICSVG